jgi:hypothetical protein
MPRLLITQGGNEMTLILSIYAVGWLAVIVGWAIVEEVR